LRIEEKQVAHRGRNHRRDHDPLKRAIVVEQRSRKRNHERSGLDDCRKRVADDQPVFGIGGELAEGLIVAARLPDDERLRRVTNRSGRVDDGDRAGVAEAGARRGQTWRPVLRRRRRAADSAAVHRQLPQRAVVCRERFPQVL